MLWSLASLNANHICIKQVSDLVLETGPNRLLACVARLIVECGVTHSDFVAFFACKCHLLSIDQEVVDAGLVLNNRAA